MSWAMGKPPLMPLGGIGGILLGKAALANVTPEVLLTGFVLHEGLASVFGLTFGIIAAIVAAGKRYTDVPGQLALVGGGVLFGLVLWLVNFYAIAPNAFPWFTSSAWWVQLVAHALLFGGFLGLMSAGFVPGYLTASRETTMARASTDPGTVREHVVTPHQERVG